MFLLTRVQIIDQPVKYTILEPDGSNWLKSAGYCRAIVQNMSLTESAIACTPSLRAFINGQKLM